MTKRSCSWCGEFNVIPPDGTPAVCWHCGHRADAPRTGCDCPRCQERKLLAERQRKYAGEPKPEALQ